MKHVRLNFFGKVSINPSNRITQKAFTNGTCGALAKALLYLVGTPIVVTHKHAAVVVPNGKILDIQGVHSITAFQKEWGKIKIVSLQSRVFNFDAYGASEWRKSIPVAKELLKKYNTVCGLT